MTSQKTKLFACAIVLTALVSSPLAHEGATGIVLERMEQMKAMSKSIKRIGKLLLAETPDADIITQEAKRIAEDSTHVPHMFPEGSFNHPSEASLNILEDRDRFAKLNSQMKVEADTLATLASSNSNLDKVRASVLRLADSCKACHKVFREKKD